MTNPIADEQFLQLLLAPFPQSSLPAPVQIPDTTEGQSDLCRRITDAMRYRGFRRIGTYELTPADKATVGIAFCQADGVETRALIDKIGNQNYGAWVDMRDDGSQQRRAYGATQVGALVLVCRKALGTDD